MQPQLALPDVPDRAALDDIYNAPGSPFLDDVLLNTAWDESDFAASQACHTSATPRGPEPSAHSTSSAQARTSSFQTLHSHAFDGTCKHQPWGFAPYNAAERPLTGSSPTTELIQHPQHPLSHPHASPQPPPLQAPSPTPMQRTSDWGGLAHHHRRGQTSEGAPRSPASGNLSADTPHHPHHHQHHHHHHHPATHSAMAMLPPGELPPQPDSFYPAQPLAAAWQCGPASLPTPAPAGYGGSALPPRSFAAGAAAGGPPGMPSTAAAGAWSGGAGADPLCTALRSPASASASASPAGAATPPAAVEAEALASVANGGGGGDSGGGGYYLPPPQAGADPRDPGGPMAVCGALTTPVHPHPHPHHYHQQQQGAGGWWAGDHVPGSGEAMEAAVTNAHQPPRQGAAPPPPSSSPFRPTAGAPGPGPAWAPGGPQPPAAPAWGSPRTRAMPFTTAPAYPRLARLYPSNPYHPYARPHPHPKPLPQHAPPYGFPSAPAGLPSLPSPSHALSTRRAAFGPPSPLTGAPLPQPPYRPIPAQYGSGPSGGFGRVSDSGVSPPQLPSPRNARPLAPHLPPRFAVAGPGTPRRSAPGTIASFSSAAPAAAAAPLSTTAGSGGLCGGVDAPVLGSASQLSSSVPSALPQQQQEQQRPHLVVHPPQEPEGRLPHFQQHQQQGQATMQLWQQPVPRPAWHTREAPVSEPSGASHQPSAPHCGPTPPVRAPGPGVVPGQDLPGAYLTSEAAAMASRGAPGPPYECGPGRRSAPGGWPAAADGYSTGVLPMGLQGAVQQEERQRLLAHFDSRMLEQVQERKRTLHAQLMQPYQQQQQQHSDQQDDISQPVQLLLPRQQQLVRDELPQQQQELHNQLVQQQQQHQFLQEMYAQQWHTVQQQQQHQCAQVLQLPGSGSVGGAPAARSHGPTLDSPFVRFGRYTGGGDGGSCGGRARDPGTAPTPGPGLGASERPAKLLRLGQGGSFVFGGGAEGAGHLDALAAAGAEEAARGTRALVAGAADAACAMGVVDGGVSRFGGRGGRGSGGRVGGEGTDGVESHHQQQRGLQQHRALGPVLATVSSMALGGGQTGGGGRAAVQCPRGGAQAGLTGCPAASDSPFPAASAQVDDLPTWVSEPAPLHADERRPTSSFIQAQYSYPHPHPQQQQQQQQCSDRLHNGGHRAAGAHMVHASAAGQGGSRALQLPPQSQQQGPYH